MVRIWDCLLYTSTSYSSSSAHPGLIRMGDVNGSGSIDKEDLDELIDAVYDGEVTGKAQEGMDLNLSLIHI